MKRSALFLFASLVFWFAGGSFALARDPSTITDWYIYSFDVSMQVNTDSSLLITEKIVADAGNLENKHGIFRVLSIQAKTDSEIFKTPIELISITDFDGKLYKYETIKDHLKKTITWKIGDPDITVNGKNNYQIVYKVKNAIRFQNQSFDELYWNLLGAFWEIPTDKFSAKIIFPEAVSEKNAKAEYYAGYLGQNQKNLAYYSWENPRTLIVNSTSTLEPGQAITISVTFPKEIFSPYQMSFFEKYGDQLWYLLFLIPLALFCLLFWAWLKYGKDPKMKTPIPPEFDIPDNITPMQMGLVLKYGFWRSNFLTAEIVNLAVQGYIKIEETEEKVFWGKHKDIKFIKKAEKTEGNLTEAEKKLMDALFENKSSEVKISELKESFRKRGRDIEKTAQKDIFKKGWIAEKSLWSMMSFVSLAAVLLWLSPFALLFSPAALWALIFSSIILAIFGVIMPRRSQAGVDLLFKIKGFERYMKQAEDYRQQFYEKENIFDKFLPYAIVFGITGLWTQKMEKIYGKDYYKNYHPVWFVSASHNTFDAGSFAIRLNSITSSISQSVSSSSGSGGSGGAGGGGGGGGGGGW